MYKLSIASFRPDLVRIYNPRAGKMNNWSNNSWNQGRSTMNSPRKQVHRKVNRKTTTEDSVEHKRQLDKQNSSRVTKGLSVDSHLANVSVTGLVSPRPRPGLSIPHLETREGLGCLTLTAMPVGEKVSPLSPSFHPDTSLSVSPRFNWRQLETAVSGSNEEKLMTQLSQLQHAVASSNAGSIRQLAANGLDLGLPFRGQTAVYLAVTLDKTDMVKELLREMMKMKLVSRNINIYSVDNASRRETALICAVRMGQLDTVRVLINYGANLELRDGEGHTALWNAVREQREEMVVYLIGRGVKIFYENNDFSCPLQLACKTPLLKESGQKIASLLVIHGANLEYKDIALRNTLFWVVYNNNRDLAYFIIQCGATMRPWSWVDQQFLPEQMKQDKLLTNLIHSASSQPQKLLLICMTSIRRSLSKAAEGRSILSSVDRLPVNMELKKILKFEAAGSQRKEEIGKLIRLCEETTV